MAETCGTLLKMDFLGKFVSLAKKTTTLRSLNRHPNWKKSGTFFLCSTSLMVFFFFFSVFLYCSSLVFFNRRTFSYSFLPSFVLLFFFQFPHWNWARFTRCSPNRRQQDDQTVVPFMSVRRYSKRREEKQEKEGQEGRIWNNQKTTKRAFFEHKSKAQYRPFFRFFPPLIRSQYASFSKTASGTLLKIFRKSAKSRKISKDSDSA